MSGLDPLFVDKTKKEITFPSGTGEGFLKLAFEFFSGKINHRVAALRHQVEEHMAVETKQLGSALSLSLRLSLWR